jgi:flagellar hook-basal body complex protein FliE
LLQNFIKDVNNDLINAKNIEQDLSLGKIQNIQDAMYQIEKADISFRLLTEIRNKALESYQEIMRMQV